MRLFCVAAALLAALCVHSESRAKTQWRVRASEGLDAVLFVGALSGDKLQGKQYPEEIARYKAKMTAEEIAALDRIGAYYAEPGRGLAGPAFAYYLAAAPDQSYAGIGAILSDPADFMKATFETALDDAAQRRSADFYLAYSALARVGFVDDWRRNVRPEIERAVARFEDFLAPYDIIPLQEKYLGRDLDDAIEVIILHYNRPYGIRVAGQRFATFHGWSADTTLRTAAHEIFHPPFDADNPALIAASERLRADPLIKNIAATTDPAFGYATFDAMLDEGSAQALDMIVSEAAGLERDPGEYWRKQDGGMHVLAAAIYHAMKETGFAETGGVYEEWLIEALKSDVLSPEAVKRRARAVMGDEAVEKWAP